MSAKSKCRCQSVFEIRLARKSDYKTFKHVLDKGRHPAFIGRDTFSGNADNGGALIYEYENEPIAVSLINPKYGILLALNVTPEHRSHGLGRAILNFLVPNFARVIESKVPWFKSCGYIAVGNLKKGQSLNTQIMAREALFTLAGRLSRIVTAANKIAILNKAHSAADIDKTAS
jgi:hypothetical protein